MTFRITKPEFKRRFGYILLGFFTFYLLDPIRNWIESNFSVNPFLVGGIGLLVTLYLFDF